MKYIVFFIVIFSIGNITDTYAFTERTTAIQEIGKIDICSIAGIDDGDTFNLDCKDGYYLNVRLLGINTPDYNTQSGKRSCFYNESRRYLSDRKEKIYKVIFYGSDLCKDSYKGCRNVVRLINLENHKDLAQMMILQGLGFSWTQFSIIPQKIKDLYTDMEKIASENNRGLWETCKVLYNSSPGIDTGIPEKMTNIVFGK